MEQSVKIQCWNYWLCRYFISNCSCTSTGLTMTRLARKGETSMNKIKSNQINQYSKLISFEHIGMKKVAWHFEYLEFLNTIKIQYIEILFIVTERGYPKLFPSESMDVRFRRSTFNHIESFHYYFALSKNSNHHLFQEVLHNQVEWIVMMEDLLNHIIQIHSILSIIVDKDLQNAA